jgi:diguanylate cyclase (GGDEF)-like protein
MTTSEGSYIVAERIRKKLENYVFKFKGEQFKVTVSMGIASLYDDIEINSADKLIEASDKALYKSKHGGKNKTSFYIDYFLE